MRTAVAGFLVFCGTPTLAQTALNWTTWTPPAYSNGYAVETLGTLSLPSSATTLYVRLLGEVREGSVFGTFNWGLAGTSTNNVPVQPTNGDMLAMTGLIPDSGPTLIKTHLLEFFADSSRVTRANATNLVLDIFSLGASTVESAYDFTNDFAIVNQGSTCVNTSGPDCLWKEVVTAASSPAAGCGQATCYRLRGMEGNGSIQFTGSFSSVKWVVTSPEIYSGFNVGATSASVAGSCNLAGARTLGQGGWASTTKSSPLTPNFWSQSFDSGLVIGLPGASVTLNSSTDVREFLPQSGTPAYLPLGDSTVSSGAKSIRNTLAGQTTAATLNLALNPGLGGAKIVAGIGIPFAGTTITELVALANSALGARSLPPATASKADLGNLTKALDAVNNSFPGGAAQGYLTCPGG